jgi:hypothetical protein
MMVEAAGNVLLSHAVGEFLLDVSKYHTALIFRVMSP